ncbi:MAG: hypothetical protein KGL32_09920 [candidate division NC10 bacterium]|nr:hypothetical protein [candidate division NC10 bacterium]
MRPFVATSLVLACVLGFNLSPTGTTLAFADEGWYGSGPMGFRPIPEMMPGREGPRPGFHGGGGHRAWPVSLMLRSKDQLGLTSDQVRALRTLRDDFQRGAITRTAQIKLAALDLRGLREQDVLDLPKVEAQVRKIALLRADQRIAHIKLIHASKSVLTPDQQEKFKQFVHGPRMEREGMDMMEPGMRHAPPAE